MINKENTGITLIALIITIIVLLILAGVSISMVVGDNGILTQAVNASTATDVAETKEQIEVALVGYYDEDGKYTTTNVESAVQEVLGDNASITENEDGTYTVTTEKGNVVDITDIMNGARLPYLVDVVEIGDYVDIELDYENIMSYSSSYTYYDYSETSGPIGWRVLSIEGSDSTGTIQLVSAGCPLSFYYYATSSLSKSSAIRNLKATISIGSGTGASNIGFRGNGFSSDDLNSLFTNNQYIDANKNIYALKAGETNTGSTNYYGGVYEIETLYNYSMETSYVTYDFYGSSSIFQTSTMLNNNSELKIKTYDLICNGMNYWLGGSVMNANGRLWCVTNSGSLSYNDSATFGIRPVVTLKSEIVVNSGDGLSSDTAYQISY